MLRKTIKYKDLDGNPLIEDFYFNLSKGEIAEWRIRAVKNGEDTLEDLIKKIKEAKDGAFIIDTFKEIIVKSVGRRSEDGKRFIKDQETTDAFMQSEAYSEFIMELFTDPNFGAAFVNSVMPADMVMEATQGKTVINLPKENVPAKIPNPIFVEAKSSVKTLSDYTQAELTEMPREQFEEIMKKSRYVL